MSLVTPRFLYDCAPVRVIDGDTVDADLSVDIGFRCRPVWRWRLRLEGIDCPEMTGATRALAWLQGSSLSNGWRLNPQWSRPSDRTASGAGWPTSAALMAPASLMRWWLPAMRSGGRHEPAGLAGRGHHRRAAHPLPAHRHLCPTAPPPLTPQPENSRHEQSPRRPQRHHPQGANAQDHLHRPRPALPPPPRARAPLMPRWIADRLPAAPDGDIHGMVRWGPLQPGLLMPWQDVRPGESWAHTTAWQPQQEGASRD